MFNFSKYKLETINESTAGFDTDKDGKKWEDYDTIVCPDGQVIDMVKLLDDLLRAKAALVHLAPMFRGFINNLRYVYTFRVQTQATDGHSIFVNPLFTYNMDLTEKCFVMAHEIMHCLLNHMRRGKAHDHLLSNLAADYEVNITLCEMGLFKIGTIKGLGGFVDEKYANVGYEKIYDEIKSAPNQGSQNNSQQAGQAGLNSSLNLQSSLSGLSSLSGQGGLSGLGGNNGGGNQNQQYSADYIAGWNKAIEDYKKGKLKL